MYNQPGDFYMFDWDRAIRPWWWGHEGFGFAAQFPHRTSRVEYNIVPDALERRPQIWFVSRKVNT